MLNLKPTFKGLSLSLVGISLVSLSLITLSSTTLAFDKEAMGDLNSVTDTKKLKTYLK